jgi:hypothetical protein
MPTANLTLDFSIERNKFMQDSTNISTNAADASAAVDTYDLHIVPAETAARKAREGENYKQLPDEQEEEDSIDTTGGFTVDKEGLANNYAIEPEMYVEVPGDLESPGNPSKAP